MMQTFEADNLTLLVRLSAKDLAAKELIEDKTDPKRGLVS